jgi:hypothetical protein
LQTFPQRAANALLSPVVSTLGWSYVRSSVERIAREFNLTGSQAPEMFRSAQLMLVNSVPGLGPPRSLPPKVKARAVDAARCALVCSFSTFLLNVSVAGCSMYPWPAALGSASSMLAAALLVTISAQGVGPLLIEREPKLLPDQLAGILEGAGPQGVVYIRREGCTGLKRVLRTCAC